MTAERFRDGTEFEVAGYARAVRHGTHIAVSGTTAPGPDVAAQTRAALDKALEAVRALGGTVEDVVRTRLFLVAGTDWLAASKVHREMLGAVAPANTTLFVAGLIGEDLLVEVEVDAELGRVGSGP